MDEMLKATHEGELVLGDKKLSCAVLNDNTRILSATAVFKAFDRPRKGKSSENYRVDQMPSFINANNLQQFVNQQLIEWTRPIPYLDLKGVVKYGYNARILRGLCKVYIDARNADALLKSQERFATISEAILYALSDLGITALVDEATGYQHEREKDELQKLLQAFISEDILPWQKTFPDIFYKELFRLNGWDYTINGIKKRPGIIGKWTNTLIYDRLPNGVLDELKKRTPKSKSGNRTARFHQLLTEDIGEPNLAAQINQIITIFRLSDNMEQMWDNFNKLKKSQDEIVSAPYEFDEKGYTKSTPLPLFPEEKIGNDSTNDDFDKGIDDILGYEPKED